MPLYPCLIGSPTQAEIFIPKKYSLRDTLWWQPLRSPSHRQCAWLQAPPSTAHKVGTARGGVGIMVTRPSAGIQSCRPMSVVSETSPRAGSRFTGCSTFAKANKDPGALLDLCFIFSPEGWRYPYQLWSVEIPRRSHKKGRRRDSFFLYSFTGFKGYNLSTTPSLSYNLSTVFCKSK